MPRQQIDQVKDLVERQKTIVIIRTREAETALTAARTVTAAGFRLIDIPVTVPEAPDVIAELAEQKDVMLGAGSVTAMHEAADVIDAGARFVVCPNTDRTIIDYCRDRGIFVAAGGMTPTEVMEAHLNGVDLVAVFPSHLIGGSRYTRTLLRVMPFLNLMPVGGVEPDIAVEHLQAGAAAVGATDAILDPDDLEKGDFETIARRAKKFFAAVCQEHEAAEGPDRE